MRAQRLLFVYCRWRYKSGLNNKNLGAPNLVTFQNSKIMICKIKQNLFCITLINFLPIIKQIPQFFILGKLFYERGRERHRQYSIHSLVGLRLGSQMSRLQTSDKLCADLFAKLRGCSFRGVQLSKASKARFPSKLFYKGKKENCSLCTTLHFFPIIHCLSVSV